MRSQLLIALALILASVGCAPSEGGIQTAIALTQAALPTNTPTGTPMPTETPTPPPTATATATPDAAATQSARVTQQAEKQSAELESDLRSLNISTGTGSLGWYQLVPQTLELVDHNSWTSAPFTEEFSASDFVLSTDITWNTPGLATCGVIFRSEHNFEKGAQYVLQILRLSGLPAWDIEYIKDGFWQNTPTGRVRTASALDQTNGATNKIVLVAKGGEFTVYINGARQGHFYDYSEQRVDGEFAFYAWQDSGVSTCKFENTSVWVYK